MLTESVPGNDLYYMGFALEEAAKASLKEEVPVGAVVVLGGRVIARGHNRTESARDATAHAEMIAIRAASEALGRWRLSGATLYVTLEPCSMCTGAAILSRIDRLVFGCCDPKSGAAGSLYNIATEGKLNHTIQVTSGVMEKECSDLLSSFFMKLRRGRKNIS